MWPVTVGEEEGEKEEETLQEGVVNGRSELFGGLRTEA